MLAELNLGSLELEDVFVDVLALLLSPLDDLFNELDDDDLLDLEVVDDCDLFKEDDEDLQLLLDDFLDRRLLLLLLE